MSHRRHYSTGADLESASATADEMAAGRLDELDFRYNKST